MAPTKKKAFKATPATTRRSKGDLVKTIAAGTDLPAAKVKAVLEALTATMAADLGKKGCGEFNFNGLMTLKTVKKPATKARPGAIRSRAKRSPSRRSPPAGRFACGRCVD